jgi:hypothetical protein
VREERSEGAYRAAMSVASSCGFQAPLDGRIEDIGGADVGRVW